jgi:hypothetical protein
MEQGRPRASLGQRWSAVQPTKTIVFWSCVGSIVVTMIIGFSWGGWVTGSTARAMAATTGEEAVVERLAPICLTQFNSAPEKDEHLKELNEISSWQRSNYVEKQGWATMPGEQDPDRQVARECARLIALANE